LTIYSRLSDKRLVDILVWKRITLINANIKKLKYVNLRMDIMNEEFNSKPTILLISPHSKVRLKEAVSYGFERRISYLGRILNKRYNMIIIEPEEKKTNKDCKTKFTFQSLSSIKIRNLRLGSLLLDINPFFLLKLIRILKKYRPSAVIISFPFGITLTSIIIKKILKLNSIVIYNSHNVETEYSKIIAKDKDLPPIIKFFYCKFIYVIEKLAIACSDYIISVSKENKSFFCKKYSLNDEKILVINLGAKIPEEIIKSDIKLRINENEVLAVFHGTYTATHNRIAMDTIQSYLSRKLRRYTDLKFILAGKGVPEFKEENIISVGFVENLYGFLSLCDIAIVPMEEGEGTKLKLFDYMAVGLPIITTKKGAEGMGLIDGENAFIIDHVDDDFVSAIENLVKNPELRKEFGIRTRKLIEEEFHPEVIKDKIYKFLDNIILEISKDI